LPNARITNSLAGIVVLQPLHFVPYILSDKKKQHQTLLCGKGMSKIFAAGISYLKLLHHHHAQATRSVISTIEWLLSRYSPLLFTFIFRKGKKYNVVAWKSFCSF